VTDFASIGRYVKLMLQCLPYPQEVHSLPLSGTPLSFWVFHPVAHTYTIKQERDSVQRNNLFYNYVIVIRC
jgi:hypothetical protein